MTNFEREPVETKPEDVQFRTLSEEQMRDLFDKREEIGLGEYQIFSQGKRNTNGLETCAAIVARNPKGEWLFGHLAGPDTSVENKSYPKIIEWLRNNPDVPIYIFGIAPTTKATQSLRTSYLEQLSNLGLVEPHFNDEPKPISLLVDSDNNSIYTSTSIKGAKVEIPNE